MDNGPDNRVQRTPRRKWGLGVFLIVLGIALLVYFRLVPGLGFFATAVEGRDADIIINEKKIPAFSSADITTSSARIEFIPSDHYGLEISMPEEYDPQWKVEGNRLTVRHKTGNVHIVGFVFNTDRYYVKVYYPKGAGFDEIQLTASSGEIKLPETEVKKLTIVTSSGNINANAVQFADAVIKASSGDINFTGRSVNGQVEIKSSSGKIDANSNGCEQVKITTSSGKINADVDGCGKVGITASSGDITVWSKNNKATNLSVKTTSGKIRVDGAAWSGLEAESSSGDIRVVGALFGATSVKASSGQVELQVNGQASQYGYDLRANSGSIHWDGRKMEKSARASDSLDNLIKVNTSSGSIKVDFK